MDGTLTKPNLDFGEMYRQCGVDPAHDILERIATMPDPVQQQRALDIIEEMEEEGRRTLELMPGAKELVSWLDAHGIPMAIVTRNTQKTTDLLLTDGRMFPTNSNNHSFSPVIARDAGYPPKPDPTAMSVIAKAWNVELPTDSLLMVGDSLSNDVAFGKNAGVRTALLDSGRRYQETLAGKTVDGLSPDFVADTLWGLPRTLWKAYTIAGRLGSSSQPSIPKVQAPEPTTPLTLASASGDIATIESLLARGASSSSSSDDDDDSVINQTDDSGNTALIWAVERNQEKAVEMLLSQSDSIDVNVRGFLGATAVSRAARRGLDSILTRLLQHGNNADPDLPNDKLQHPLHFAAFQHHHTCVRILVEQGANPLVLDRKGRTPAHDTTNEEIRTLLLEAEARNGKLLQT
jgi:phosphoglycolate phosphatase-like HAD superfamily hydrolase